MVWNLRQIKVPRALGFPVRSLALVSSFPPSSEMKIEYISLDYIEYIVMFYS